MDKHRVNEEIGSKRTLYNMIQSLFEELKTVMEEVNGIIVEEPEKETRRKWVSVLYNEEQNKLKHLKEFQRPEVIIKVEESEDDRDVLIEEQMEVCIGNDNTSVSAIEQNEEISSLMVPVVTKIEEAVQKIENNNSIPAIEQVEEVTDKNDKPIVCTDDECDVVNEPYVDDVTDKDFTLDTKDAEESIIKEYGKTRMITRRQSSRHLKKRKPPATEQTKIKKKSKTISETIRKSTESKEFEACKESFPTEFSLKVHIKKQHSVFKKACTACDETFVSNYKLKKHFQEHVDNTSNKCGVCKLGFETDEILKRHSEKHVDTVNDDSTDTLSQSDTFTCDICKFIFCTKLTLKIHKAKIHGIKDTCKICSKSFPKQKLLSKHMQVHSNTCKFCFVEFETKLEMQRHILNMHSAGSTLSCFKCHQKYENILEFAKHAETHIEESPCLCVICRRIFKLRSSLTDHLRIHTGQKPFFCGLCSESFRIKAELANHTTKEHMKKEEKEAYCKECNQKFSSKWHLHRHMKIESVERKCSECDVRFSNCREMSNHKLLHKSKDEIKERLFICETCGKTFTRNALLIDHKRIHSGEKPYQCSHCDKCFNHASALHYHKKSHENLRSFQCEVCSKLFNLQAGLRRHMKIHTGEKKYKCEVCEKTFNQKGNLLIHNRTHSGVRPYSCPLCSKTFRYSGLCNDHIKTHE